jgi:hypothetical protein
MRVIVCQATPDQFEHMEPVELDAREFWALGAFLSNHMV